MVTWANRWTCAKREPEILFKISPIIHWWRHIGSLNKFKLYGKHTQLSFRISCSSWNFETPLLWQIFVLVLRVFFLFVVHFVEFMLNAFFINVLWAVECCFLSTLSTHSVNVDGKPYGSTWCILQIAEHILKFSNT